jgi:Ner family transcriptional regulator
MKDHEHVRASEQVFGAGRDDKQPPETGFPFGMPPPDPPGDWHRADIIAAIKKSGTSLCALSRQHGLSSNSLANAFDRRWPRAEAIISEHLKVPPWLIWPSRYPAEKRQQGASEGATTLNSVYEDQP